MKGEDTVNMILKKIKQGVEKRGLTHEELSSKMNISRSYVSMLLSGERTLNKELIVLFSIVLSTPLEELLDLTNDSDYLIQTRGEFKSRAARSKIAKVKVQMDDYIRLKGIYMNEQNKS